MALQNLPNIYGAEAGKFEELRDLGTRRTPTASGTFYSDDSGTLYTYTDLEDLYQQLKIVLANYILTAEDTNKIFDNEANIATNTDNLTFTANELSMLQLFPSVGGTANALSVTTQAIQSFDYAKDGNPITILPNLSNTGATTINIDSGGVSDLLKPDGVGGTTALEADDIVIGVPFTVHRRVSGGFFLLASKKRGYNFGDVTSYNFVHAPDSNATVATLRHSFVGLGWIHSFGSGTTFAQRAWLEVDGDAGLLAHGNITNPVFSYGTTEIINVALGIKFLTGFNLYSSRAENHIMYSSDDGSGLIEKSTPKAYSGQNGVAATLRSTIIGSGIFKGFETEAGSTSISVEIDGVFVISSKNIGSKSFSCEWRFNSEIKFYTQVDTVYVNFRYNLDN